MGLKEHLVPLLVRDSETVSAFVTSHLISPDSSAFALHKPSTIVDEIQVLRAGRLLIASSRLRAFRINTFDVLIVSET